MASEEHCVKALDRHEEKLAANPHVQGLGIVAREGQPLDSEDCAVAIYVAQKPAKEDLAAEHALPETLEIEHEGTTHAVPVRVIEQGPVRLEGPGLEPAGGALPGLEGPLGEPGLEEPDAGGASAEPGPGDGESSEE